MIQHLYGADFCCSCRNSAASYATPGRLLLRLNKSQLGCLILHDKIAERFDRCVVGREYTEWQEPSGDLPWNCVAFSSSSSTALTRQSGLRKMTWQRSLRTVDTARNFRGRSMNLYQARLLPVSPEQPCETKAKGDGRATCRASGNSRLSGEAREKRARNPRRAES